MPKASSAMKRGKIIFYDDTTKKPKCPGCRTAVTYYQRCYQNSAGERGGWWSISVLSDGSVNVSGPFETLAEADRVGRAQAERMGCTFVPATPEEIAAAEVTEAEFLADAEAFRNGTFVPRFD